MVAEQKWIGIDVSKLRLDVHIHPGAEALSVPNDAAGLRAIFKRLKQLEVAAIGLEASGGLERKAANALAGRGYAVHLLDPAQVNAYGKAMKQKAKTDALDAAIIARYVKAAAEQGVLRPYRPDQVLAALAALLALRRTLLDAVKLGKAQLGLAEEPLVKRIHKSRLAQTEAQLKQIDASIRRQIEAEPELAHRAEQLATIPGVGPILTATLLADLKELGAISSREVASLTGVAPHARQSGKLERSGKCSGGRKAVRDVLYMATLSAVRAKKPHLYPFYKRLREAGKPFKVAIIAAARKFLTIINAIIRDNTVFRTSQA